MPLAHVYSTGCLISALDLHDCMQLLRQEVLEEKIGGSRFYCSCRDRLPIIMKTCTYSSTVDYCGFLAE